MHRPNMEAELLPWSQDKNATSAVRLPGDLDLPGVIRMAEKGLIIVDITFLLL